MPIIMIQAEILCHRMHGVVMKVRAKKHVYGYQLCNHSLIYALSARGRMHEAPIVTLTVQ